MQMVLQAVKKLAKPQNKILISVERDFEIALSSCIKAAEATERFIDLTDYHREGVLFSQIINQAVLAHEYSESVYQKLTGYEHDSKRFQSNPEEKIILKEVTPANVIFRQNRVSDDQNVVIPQKAPENIIETGLDKVGDGIIYLIDKIQKAFTCAAQKLAAKKPSN